MVVMPRQDEQVEGREPWPEQGMYAMDCEHHRKAKSGAPSKSKVD